MNMQGRKDVLVAFGGVAVFAVEEDIIIDLV